MYDLMEPSEIVSVRGAPCGAEHLFTVRVTVCDLKSINGSRHCPGDSEACGSTRGHFEVVHWTRWICVKVISTATERTILLMDQSRALRLHGNAYVQ